MKKISIIVPTYNTDPERLTALIASIEGQSMDQQDYELLIIDDGSTSGIYTEIEKLSQEKTFVHSWQIENSGWGSRPRNIGLTKADGEYVLFMDHDDLLFPEALEKVYQFAQENDLDVINCKEVRTNGWSWGWDVFQHNQVYENPGNVLKLQPMTPHKFYRRTFLLDHNIRFEEGKRVLWEDVYLNTSCAIHGAKVGVLADTPCYHWVHTGENSSSSFGKDVHEKWEHINLLFRFFQEEITDETDRKNMILHWYWSRVLGIMGKKIVKRKRETMFIELGYAQKLRADYITGKYEEGIKQLAVSDQQIDWGIVQGDLDYLYRNGEEAAKWAFTPVLEHFDLKDGKLVFHVRGELSDGEKTPLLFKKKRGGLQPLNQGKLLSKLPRDIRVFPLKEVTNGHFSPSLKGRHTRITWPLHSVQSQSVTLEQESLFKWKVLANCEFSLDLKDFIANDIDANQPWDLAIRFEALGMIIHRAITCGKSFEKAVMVDGLPLVVYKNQSELLSIDCNNQVKSFFKAAKIKEAITKEIDEQKAETTIFFKDVYISGDYKENCLVTIGEQDNPLYDNVPAYFMTNDGELSVTFVTPVLPDKFPVTIHYKGRHTLKNITIKSEEA